jgi:hypothetical protein
MLNTFSKGSHKLITCECESMWWYSDKALNFLDKLYSKCSIALNRKMNLYLQWLKYYENKNKKCS